MTEREANTLKQFLVTQAKHKDRLEDRYDYIKNFIDSLIDDEKERSLLCHYFYATSSLETDPYCKDVGNRYMDGLELEVASDFIDTLVK